jgi:hypothetical protein
MDESSSYLRLASFKWRHRQIGFLAFFGFSFLSAIRTPRLCSIWFLVVVASAYKIEASRYLEANPHLEPRAINSHLAVPIQHPYYHVHEHGLAGNPIDIPSNRLQATEEHSIHNWVRRAGAQHCPCGPGSEVPRSRDTRHPIIPARVNTDGYS